MLLLIHTRDMSEWVLLRQDVDILCSHVEGPTHNDKQFSIHMHPFDVRNVLGRRFLPSLGPPIAHPAGPLFSCLLVHDGKEFFSLLSFKPISFLPSSPYLMGCMRMTPSSSCIQIWVPAKINGKSEDPAHDNPPHTLNLPVNAFNPSASLANSSALRFTCELLLDISPEAWFTSLMSRAISPATVELWATFWVTSCMP